MDARRRARFNVESAAFRRNDTPGNYPGHYSKLVGSSFAHASRTQCGAIRAMSVRVYTYVWVPEAIRAARERMHLPKGGEPRRPHARNMPEVIGESRKGSSADTTRETALKLLGGKRR